MIISIIIGRENSKGFPNKNIKELKWIPLMAHPIIASKNSKQVDYTYFSTESEKLKKIAIKYGARIIDRPKHLATDEALGEDVFIHAYNLFCNDDTKRLKGIVKEVNLFVLMFANAPCITANMIDEMVSRMQYTSDADSCITVSEYNQYSPYRMKVLVESESYVDRLFLEPFCKELNYEDVNCDRNSGKNAYIYDCSCAVVRPHCLENIENGMLPQRWVGRKIIPYVQEFPALDIDYSWQWGQLIAWKDYMERKKINGQ